jgi:hypothetical protein
MRSFEDGDDADNNSTMGRSDLLESPVNSDEDDGDTSIPNYDFHAMDLKDPSWVFE